MDMVIKAPATTLRTHRLMNFFPSSPLSPLGAKSILIRKKKVTKLNIAALVTHLQEKSKETYLNVLKYPTFLNPEDVLLN